MDPAEPIDFERAIPLFPLPNAVLFPGVVQPLHIFEPRYLEMIAAALRDQRAVAMALLRPGWEEEYYGRPAIFGTVCVGRIVAHEQVEEGKYNLLLQGMARASVEEERRQGLYRVAMLAPLADTNLTPPAEDDAAARQTILELFERSRLCELSAARSVRELIEKEVATSRIVDVVAFGIVQDVAVKQRLLEQLDPLKRAALLIDQLADLVRQLPPPPRKRSPGQWPPGGGMN